MDLVANPPICKIPVVYSVASHTIITMIIIIIIIMIIVTMCASFLACRVREDSKINNKIIYFLQLRIPGANIGLKKNYGYPNSKYSDKEKYFTERFSECPVVLVDHQCSFK